MSRTEVLVAAANIWYRVASGQQSVSFTDVDDTKINHVSAGQG